MATDTPNQTTTSNINVIASIVIYNHSYQELKPTLDSLINAPKHVSSSQLASSVTVIQSLFVVGRQGNGITVTWRWLVKAIALAVVIAILGNSA